MKLDNKFRFLIKKPKKSTLIFIAVFFILIIGALYAYNRNQGQSEIDLGKVIETKNGNIINNDFAIIPTKIVPNRKKTVVTIPFIPPKERVEVWLSLRLNNEKLINTLMSHPDLNKINWGYVSSERYTLFQKNKNFNNIDDFLKNIPDDAQIQADPDIVMELLSNYSNASKLAAEINFNEVDYILTTYKPFYKENKWSVFKSVFDASDAFVDKDTIFWTLSMKGVSPSNPFVFEHIYVDYLQDNLDSMQPMRIQ